MWSELLIYLCIVNIQSSTTIISFLQLDGIQKLCTFYTSFKSRVQTSLPEFGIATVSFATMSITLVVVVSLGKFGCRLLKYIQLLVITWTCYTWSKSRREYWSIVCDFERLLKKVLTSHMVEDNIVTTVYIAYN